MPVLFDLDLSIETASKVSVVLCVINTISAENQQALVGRMVTMLGVLEVFNSKCKIY